jgi:ribulose-5-phosphate 4-epimerase/fuculose-1-phosphate aldolase
MSSANLARSEKALSLGITAEEWALRIQLAACYRIFDLLGWTEYIFNHITLRVPGPEKHFLINPFGLWYSEVTASNLVKIDLDGNTVGKSEYPVNKAGFVIHSAIHAVRPDAHCIMHTHTTAGVAVACQEQGIAPNNFYGSQLHGRIAYHDFEGISVELDERPRLVKSLGDRNVMVLRNHGLLVCGGGVAEALRRMLNVQRACEVQLAAEASGKPITKVPVEICQRAAAQGEAFDPAGYGSRLFTAFQRRIDGIDPGYRE